MRCLSLLFLSLTLSGFCWADEEPTAQFTFDESYQLGVAKYELDAHTEMTGWQISSGWYFGRQRGEDSGLTLVWQRQQDQMSISKDGIRFTRRF